MAQHSQNSVRKCARHTVKPGALTLVRQEEPQLPLHAKQMRSGLKATLRTAPSLIFQWKNNPPPSTRNNISTGQYVFITLQFFHMQMCQLVFSPSFTKGYISLYTSQFCFCSAFFSSQHFLEVAYKIMFLLLCLSLRMLCIYSFFFQEFKEVSKISLLSFNIYRRNCFIWLHISM